MGERSQRRLTAAARRAQLIDVGRAVFAKRGYEATSVEDIAEHAKISKPIIYEHVERAALAFLTYVKDHPDGFAVLAHGAPVATATGGMSSLLNDVAERVGDIFAATFKEAGYDSKTAPIYAHALIGMVTSVGQWWTEARKPSIEDVATHLSALAWMGLRHLPKRPTLTTKR